MMTAMTTDVAGQRRIGPMRWWSGRAGAVDPLASGSCALYRLWNRAGLLLYVGIADDPRARWKQHAATKEWWDDVYRREVEWFATRSDADAAETKAIAQEWPIYNKAKRPDDGPQYTPKDRAALWIEHAKKKRITLFDLAHVHLLSNQLSFVTCHREAYYPVDPEALLIFSRWMYNAATPWQSRVHMWMADNVYNEISHRIVTENFVNQEKQEREIRIAKADEEHQVKQQAKAEAEEAKASRRTKLRNDDLASVVRDAVRAELRDQRATTKPSSRKKK